MALETNRNYLRDNPSSRIIETVLYDDKNNTFALTILIITSVAL